MDEISLIFNRAVNFRLWQGIPREAWLRPQGRTRVLVIDDDVFERGHLFPAEGSKIEQLFLDRLNLDVTFFEMPKGYGRGPATTPGLFTESWFHSQLRASLEDPRPIAAIVLDLRFGLDDPPDQPAGARFLQILRRQPSLEVIPIIVASNVLEAPRLSSLLKGMGSYQDFVQKSFEVNLPEELFRKVIMWGWIADPTLGAFSLPMRKLAQKMRQIVIVDQYSEYESSSGERRPTPVLFLGDLGSGKSYLAQALQGMSVRAGKCLHTVTFSGLTRGDNTAVTLFGSGPSADAPTRYYTEPSTGFLLREHARNATPLNSQGILHIADTGIKLYTSAEARTTIPEPGTVVIDELSEAPEECQGMLLEVLNHGRFRPNLSSSWIPSERRLGVWLLFTCSSAGYSERLRDDLKSRFSRFHSLTVPRLLDRTCDVLPLAIRMLSNQGNNVAGIASPDEVFTRGAREFLAHLTSRISVRQLDGVIRALSSVTAKMPFNEEELRYACKVEACAEIGVEISTPASAAVGSLTANGIVDWLFDRPVPQYATTGLRPLTRAKTAAASLLLGLLDRVLLDELPALDIESTRKVAATSIWRRLSGDTEEANTALTNLAKLMTIDLQATCRAAKESPRLRWLLCAKEMSKRNVALRAAVLHFIDDVAGSKDDEV